MSLFKERAVNAKKLISLNNTILALKKELASIKQNSDSSRIVELEAQNKLLQEEVALLKAELETLRTEQEKPPVKRRPGRRKAQKKETGSNESPQQD